MRNINGSRLIVALGVVATSGMTVQSAQAAPAVLLKLPANIAPVPDYNVWGSSTSKGVVTYTNPCVLGANSEPAYSNSPACTNFVLLALDAARALEGIKPMILPLNWYLLSATKQLFVIADLERVDRGLPPLHGVERGTQRQRAGGRREVDQSEPGPGLRRWSQRSRDTGIRSDVGPGHVTPHGRLLVDVRRRLGRRTVSQDPERRLHLRDGARLLGPPRRAARLGSRFQPRGRALLHDL